MPSHDWKDLEPKTIGQWRDILMSLGGLTDRELSGKHGPCPGCGGKDRFRFDDNLEQRGDGGYICGQCGSGAGINLLMMATGQPFNVAVNAVGDFLGAIPVERFERNQVAASKPFGPSYSKEDSAKAKEWLAMGTHMPCCELTLRHGIGPDGLLVSKRSGAIICPIHASGRGVVNAAVITAGYPDEKPIFAAGGMTYGGATVVGADTGKSIIICADWFDSWHVHLATGCRVLCCWVPENVRHVAESITTQKPIIMAARVTLGDLAAAEAANLRVVVPTGMWESFSRHGTATGVERKLYDPTIILDQLEQA